MTINTENIAGTKQTQHGHIVPVFMPKTMERLMASQTKTPQTQEDNLSLFDVKELYDLAYIEKDKGQEGEKAFKKLLAEAVKLDMAYRRQLAQKVSYKDNKQLKTFKAACTGDNSRVA